MRDSHEYNPVLQAEFMHSALGPWIGTGMCRRVFNNLLDGTAVIKLEDCNGSRFQNVLEWETWCHVKGTEHAIWFAPCLWISASGGILIQRKTSVPTKFPDKLPLYLTDTKRSNYGMVDGRFVCHDYGTNLLMEWGTSKRTRKVEWRDE